MWRMTRAAYQVPLNKLNDLITLMTWWWGAREFLPNDSLSNFLYNILCESASTCGAVRQTFEFIELEKIAYLDFSLSLRRN